MRTPKNTYRKFIEFEERVAAIYLELASRFSKDPELSSFWLDMATHEKQHAGLLQFCLRDSLFVPDLPNSAEIQKLTNFFKRLEKRAADPEAQRRASLSAGHRVGGFRNQYDLLLPDNNVAQLDVSVPAQDRNIAAQPRR